MRFSCEEPPGPPVPLPGAGDDVPLPQSHCAEGTGEPLIGAIRWDAWVPGNDIPLRWVSASLYTKFSHRQPLLGWYPTGDDELAAQQAMDLELEVAASRGLDYWAFVWYPTEEPNHARIQEAFERYLSSKHRDRMKFSLILQAGWLAYTVDARDLYTEAFVPRFVEWFQHPSYLTVCGGRPLVFLFGLKDLPLSRLHLLRNAVIEAMSVEPFFVDVNHDTPVATRYGVHGVGAYGPAGAAVFGSEHHCWKKQREADLLNFTRLNGMRAIASLTPMADPRPRGLARWVDQPTATEWREHVAESLEWMREHPEASTDPPTALIYSWNELDEGGPGITPTWQEGTRYLDGILEARTGLTPAQTWNEINPTHCSVQTAGTWDWHFPAEGLAGNYDNDEHRTEEPLARMSVTLESASTVEILGTLGPDRGNLRLEIDGALMEERSLYSPEVRQREVLLRASALGPGPHVVEVIALGTNSEESSGAGVGIDSIRWLVE